MTGEDAAEALWRKAIAPFVLLLIVIGFFWKLLLTNQYSWLQSVDLAYQVLPWFQFQAAQFHQHVVPLWDPYQFAGQSLIGQAQPGLAYPLNWILFSLPLRGGHISYHYLNWYYMFIHYFAALFCYWLCRDLGRGQIASVIGGISFGLGGYVGSIDWPQIINGAIWCPLVFLFLFRSLRGLRPNANAALSGFFLGIAWLSGHHLVPTYLSLATVGVWGWAFFENGRHARRLIVPAAAFLIFTALTSAFQVLPTLSYAHTAVRWVGSQHDPITWNQSVPYTVHQQFSLNPKYLLGLVIPGYENGATAYVGIVGLALAGLALARFWGAREVRILFSVGIAGLLFALGYSDVFHGILYSLLPLVEKGREPMNGILLFHFPAAALIAYGADSLVDPAARPSLRRLSAMLSWFGAATFVIVFGVFVSNQQKWPGDDRVMITVLAALALAGLVYRMSSATGAAVYAIPVLIGALYLLELGNSGALYYLPHVEDKERNIYLGHLDDTREVADFLRHQPGPIRVWTNGEDVPFNFGDWYGIDVLFGYAPSVPANFHALEPWSRRTRQLYSTAYTVSRKPLFADQTEVFRDSKGLAVYQNPDVMPRVWTVHESVQVRNAGDARAHLQDAGFDLHTRTFSYAPIPALEKCDGDEVRNSARGTNWSRAVVEMKCRGLVVIGENYDSGLVATVDGQAAPVYSAYTALQSVVVSAGTHNIEMRYRPFSVRAGAVASGLGLLGAILLSLGGGKRPDPLSADRGLQ